MLARDHDRMAQCKQFVLFLLFTLRFTTGKFDFHRWIKIQSMQLLIQTVKNKDKNFLYLDPGVLLQPEPKASKLQYAHWQDK